MIRTTRKQATLQLNERKLCLLIEESLLADYKLFHTTGNKVVVKFITGTYDDELIRKVMRNYLKGGWNVYRTKDMTVDKTPPRCVCRELYDFRIFLIPQLKK